MNKVMTRNKAMAGTTRHPAGRPPARHDTRRPGGTPRRTAPPGGGTSRTAPSGPGRPRPSGPATTNAPGRTGPAGTATADSTGPAGTTTANGTGRTGPLPQPPPQPRPTDVFADRLLSVLSGQRPVHSMLRHTVGRAYDELARLAERGPLRTRGIRPVVRDIGYYVPRPGAIEAFARIGAGDQLRAMAFRLECGPDYRWRCTAVELGGPRMPRTDDA
ncbi:Rv3235 family protein [Streptomyces sp. TP-A0356]|uniref:Rv3235 family protein n=1 Tax=Streptomyces sp. TP-A0356 TaxID=1359208 RepID=UPI0006E30760|nr:Rv3235 family protein [Streptomyces sp. TP-A0356]